MTEQEVFIEELNSRLLKVEERLALETRTLDHRGLAVVAGEGLRGGGTLEKSRALALGFEDLTHGRPKVEEAIFPFFNSTEGEHQICDLGALVDIVIRSSNFNDRFRELFERVAEIELKLQLLTIYTRVEILEAELEVLKKEKDDAVEERKAS